MVTSTVKSTSAGPGAPAKPMRARCFHAQSHQSLGTGAPLLLLEVSPGSAATHVPASADGAKSLYRRPDGHASSGYVQLPSLQSPPCMREHCEASSHSNATVGRHAPTKRQES